MAESGLFSKLLSKELRWPRASDRPFVKSDDFDANASVAGDGFTRHVLMIDGYKKAADILVDAADADWRDRDLLVFPIIFNYRQFFELSLKYQLASFGLDVGVNPNWKTHDLPKLWTEFTRMLKAYQIEDPEKADVAVGEIVSKFANLDPGSFSYRYPVNRDGHLLPIAHQTLHLRHLANVMEKVAGYFRGCDGYLSSLRDTRT